MKCLVLKRKEYVADEVGGWRYLIANGMSMGRWTSHFGVHCLADTLDTINHLKYAHEVHEGSIIEEYKLTKTST